MSNNTLKAVKRERAGKGAARAVRREQSVPAVVYGAKQEPQTISIDPRLVMKEMQSGVFFNTVYELDIDGKTEKVLPRDAQFHVVKDSLQHVDFMRVDEKSKVKVSVPVEYQGQDVNDAIKMGGRLQIVRREVELLAGASVIPHKLIVDVSEVKFGGIIRMSNVDLADGVRPTITDRDFVLASLKAPRGAELDEDLDAEVVDENEEARKEEEATAAAETEEKSE
ncbi:MAG: 50S ribosomal protein L25/general stress protein Ctc [Alphaproteobacteria bacterium]